MPEYEINPSVIESVQRMLLDQIVYFQVEKGMLDLRYAVKLICKVQAVT